jgi:hypothetical protein
MKIFISTLFLLFSYNLAFACSCGEPTAAKKAEAIKSASVIFYGKIISVNSSENQIKAKFHVLRSWKGLEKNEIDVTTASESSACGVNFKVGDTRLIYTYSIPASTSTCSMLLVDEKLLRETLGEGKTFENMPSPQPETQEPEGFFAWLWRKITSFFT